MIFDAFPYLDTSKNSGKSTALASFVDFIERKLGVRAIYDLRNIPFGNLELLEPLRIAQSFIERGILTSFAPVQPFFDEPHLRIWGALCNTKKNDRTGGASQSDDKAALTAALAEGLERYLWFTQNDYFVDPIRATPGEIAKKDHFLTPERFVGFSDLQRSKNPNHTLHEDATYLWIKAQSLISSTKVYIPAQVASASFHPTTDAFKEPLIRQQTTIGLATWPTLAGARLAGALEVIEREALMIMWYNQLTLPRIQLTSITGKNKSLDALLASCARYNLKVHAIPMMTDAPTHAVCVILEDLSGCAPRFALGLKAHRSLPYAVERAITEALRARHGYRNFFQNGGTFDTTTPLDSIGHIQRLHYWGIPENAKRLEFLVEGPEYPHLFDTPWEESTPEQHLEQVLAWCKEKSYECLSVSLGTSKANSTPWHVEFVIMPDLQPTHLHEQLRHLGGTRLKSVPESFGFTPRKEPFIGAPHPYA